MRSRAAGLAVAALLALPAAAQDWQPFDHGGVVAGSGGDFENGSITLECGPEGAGTLFLIVTVAEDVVLDDVGTFGLFSFVVEERILGIPMMRESEGAIGFKQGPDDRDLAIALADMLRQGAHLRILEGAREIAGIPLAGADMVLEPVAACLKAGA